jgi:hypothetical protein
MAIDIREISLTEDQKRRIAELAEQTGRSWREVLDEQLAMPAANGIQGHDLSDDDRYIKDKDKRIAFFRHWIAQQTSHNPNFDDSRDSIYP